MEALGFSTKDLLGAVYALRATNASTVAAVILMVYDYLLTLPDEVELIWRSKWTAVKVLFLLTRYLPFLELFPLASFMLTRGDDVQACSLKYHILAWMEVMGLSFAVALLSFRTWAVWNKSLTIGIILAVAFFAQMGASMALTSRFLTLVKFIPVAEPYNWQCLKAGEKVYLTMVRIVILAYDTGTLFLMLWKGISQYSFLDRAGSLERAVFASGLMYYFFLFCHTVTSVFLMRFLPFKYINLTTVLDRFLHSILACRAILHIRYEHQQAQLQHCQWDDIKFTMSSQAEDNDLPNAWDRQNTEQGPSYYDASAESRGQSNV
ncbi:hypothetical protein BKA70DRAFT_1313493 [Coprinopsis sp. MPI-PUGE-AT-0042]|nr:hypothetical protein BKA70DRAFT_1313493 [Coprinopsis sp. MPI-PUGE-AT-0042]